jgi:radical SAM protein with 4Fe4S-binding SPASM domain
MIKYTELSSTNRQNLREILPLAKPFTVLIEPSSLCNFRCIQCFQSIKTESYFTRNLMNMPMERFRRVIGQLQQWPGPKLKVLKLNLYGEPLVSPDFPEMLELAKQANITERIETTTNASLLTPEVAESMIKNGLDYLRVSIYATEQDRHQRVTGSTLNIRRIRDNLVYLQEAKRRADVERPFVSCKMLDQFNDENKRFLSQFSDIADEVYLDKPHRWIKVENNDFIKNLYAENVGIVETDLQVNSTPRVACPMPFTTMAVRSNGAVSPCCVDYIGGTNLGHVDKHSLQELWKSSVWLAFQVMQLENRKHENSSCARCDIYRSNHYTKDNIDGFQISRLRPLMHPE